MRSVMLSARLRSARRCAATASASRLPVVRSSAALTSARRPADAASGANGRVARRGARQAPRAGRRCGRRSRRGAPFRAAAMASGSMSRPISRAMSDSRGKRQHLGAEGRLQRLVLGDLGERVDEGGIEARRLAGAGRRGAGDQRGIGEALGGLPAVEGVGVGAEQEQEIVRRRGRSSSFTGAEKPRSSDGIGGAETPCEDEGLLGLGEVDHVAVDRAAADAVDGRGRRRWGRPGRSGRECASAAWRSARASAATVWVRVSE